MDSFVTRFVKLAFTSAMAGPPAGQRLRPRYQTGSYDPPRPFALNAQLAADAAPDALAQLVHVELVEIDLVGGIRFVGIAGCGGRLARNDAGDGLVAARHVALDGSGAGD